jgi:hypothetical protein
MANEAVSGGGGAGEAVVSVTGNGRSEAIDPEAAAARPAGRPTREQEKEQEIAAGAALLEAVRRMNVSPEDIMRMLPTSGSQQAQPAHEAPQPQAQQQAQPQTQMPQPTQTQMPAQPQQAPPQAQETARPRDPREAPPHYVPVLEQALMWTMSAIERTIDGNGRGTPLHGRLLGELDRGKERDPLLMFFLDEPLLVSDRTGRRFVEARPGQRVVVHASHALRSLLPLTRLDGCPIVHLLPTGILVGVNGEREVGFEVNVEPDPRDPRNPRLVSRESLLGRRQG